MRIQPITNNSFMGKYIYNSNPGYWWVEYHPYSWENGNSSTPEPVEYVDIMSSKLPNNEQTVKSTYRYGILQKEVSSDIRGINTSIYDATKDTTKNRVLNKSSMNREESIKEFITKLTEFQKMKSEYKRILEADRNIAYNQMRELDLQYKEYLKDYHKGLIMAQNPKRENVELMAINEAKIMEKSNSINIITGKLEELNKSMNNVNRQITELKEELELIANIRNSGRKIIDISRRDIADADKPLMEALTSDYKNVANYFVMLPHKIMPMDKIFTRMISRKKSPMIPEEVIEHVAKLINYRK